jgi:hypothetical protein
MVDPKEGEVICDPASGSGGFLIRSFDIVRQQILADADRRYREYAEELGGKRLSEPKRAELLRRHYDEIQATIDQRRMGTRMWKLSNTCVARVKASLLFLQKLTANEQADFDKKQAAAKSEVEAKYADEIAMETARLEAAIKAAKEAKNTDARKAVQGESRDYRKRMEDTKTREARALLKDRFDYPIFLYDAEKVGISATGEPDANERYPNDRMPTGMQPEETCLELYRRFCKNPEEFALETQP